MSKINDILEICLQEIENGADVDTVLFQHPENAEELRPILEAAVQARSAAVPNPSTDVMRRGRAKVLQQAALMREAQVQPSRRLWSVPLRRALVSLAVIAVLFVGSTRLVHASSTTLPGDNLYPVKRTWEDLRVMLTFNTQARTALEVEQENERLDELNDLFAKGRSAPVDFAGTVTAQNGDLWLVAKIPVLISAQTETGSQQIKVGDAIHITGYTQADGNVLANRVELLPAGMPLPDIDDDHVPSGQNSLDGQNEGQNNSNETEDASGKGSGDQSPKASETKSPEDEADPRTSSMNGIVDSINGSQLVVNNQSMDISGAQVNGTPRVGTVANVEGYYDANGVFIVTKIEFGSSGSSSGGSSDKNGSKDGGGSNSGSNDDGGDDGSSSGSGGDG